MMPDGFYIYELVTQAVENVFGEDSYPTAANSDALMNIGFYSRIWELPEIGDDPSEFVTMEEVELLRAYAGPHGFAIWKAKLARGSKHEKVPDDRSHLPVIDRGKRWERGQRWFSK